MLHKKVTSSRIGSHGFGSKLRHQVKTGLGINHIAYLIRVVNTCTGCGVGVSVCSVNNARGLLLPVSTINL
jgi:hypothetical protein